MSSIDKAVESYHQIMQSVLKLDVFQPNRNFGPDDKGKNIENSKEAKGHFFSFDYLEKYKNAVKSDDKIRDKQFEAVDSIDYYNKKYSQKDAKVVKISGAFFKVRSQGGASGRDIDELNKFYKRSLVTLFMAMAHSYVVINFLYDSRFVTPRGTPRLFANLPWAVYPTVLIGCIGYIYTQNSSMMGKLDRKYTPLWLEISKKI